MGEGKLKVLLTAIGASSETLIGKQLMQRIEYWSRWRPEEKLRQLKEQTI